MDHFVSVLIVIFILIFSTLPMFDSILLCVLSNIVFRCAIQQLFSLQVGLPLTSTRAATARGKFHFLDAFTYQTPPGRICSAPCSSVTQREAFSQLCDIAVPIVAIALSSVSPFNCLAMLFHLSRNSKISPHVHVGLCCNANDKNVTVNRAISQTEVLSPALIF